MKAIVTTERDNIRAVLQRHREQFRDRSFRYMDGTTAGEVQDRLAALNLETCSGEDVTKAIGSDWTTPRCDACGRNALAIVTVGQEPDYETATASLCIDCLHEAAEAMQAATIPNNSP